MSKTDLRARPFFARTREAIEAHLTIVFTALAVSRTIQDRTGLSIRKVLRDLRPLRSATIEAGGRRHRRRSRDPGRQTGAPRRAQATVLRALSRMTQLRSVVGHTARRSRVSNVQDRPCRPAHLPPHARGDRSSPHDRVRSPCHRPRPARPHRHQHQEDRQEFRPLQKITVQIAGHEHVGAGPIPAKAAPIFSVLQAASH